jgi:predicted methyltransferase
VRYRSLTDHRIAKDLLIAGLLGMSLSIAPSFAEEANVNPGINQYYYDAEYERWVNVFERPGRELFDKRYEIINTLNLKPAMVVADIGAGTGLFTRLFAEKVEASGRVYAVDISKPFISSIERIANEQGLANIRGIVNTDKSTGLPSNSIDLAFLADTYHHFEYPQTMLASIRQALRPQGRLVIIDFRKQPGVSSGWVMSHVRADKAAVIKEVTAAGFELVADSDLLTSNYFLTFVNTAQ